MNYEVAQRRAGHAGAQYSKQAMTVPRAPIKGAEKLGLGRVQLGRRRYMRPENHGPYLIAARGKEHRCSETTFSHEAELPERGLGLERARAFLTTSSIAAEVLEEDSVPRNARPAAPSALSTDPLYF